MRNNDTKLYQHICHRYVADIPACFAFNDNVRIMTTYSFVLETIPSILTCMEVIEAAWACRTMMGAQVRRHHTLMILSQLAEAIRVFSWLTAMSEISAEWPRSVARSRPSSVAQIFTRQSSEP